MCIIIDANKFSDFLNPENDDMQPIRDWVSKKGKIAYSPTAAIEAELNRSPKFRNHFFSQYVRKGKTKLYDKEKVDAIQNSLSGLKSNDHHIIALAKAGNIKLLVSGDQALHEDFRNIIKGKIYQNKKHTRLLSEHSCP